MQFKGFVLSALLGAIGVATGAEGTPGTLRYQIGSSAAVNVTSEQDIPINVGTVSGTVVVRIWDPSLGSGVPDDGVGKITINGSWSSGGELRLLIAGTGDSWPDPTDMLNNPGLRDLGLNSGDGIEITDADLRKNTRLAAYVSGDIHGTIEVGQVQRIQCGNLDPNNVTGTIYADITATALHWQFGNAIGRIYAGNSIAGAITATGDSSFDPENPNTFSNIGSIIVGPGSDAAGIMADIKAEKGSIGQVYTTGPIGSATITPKIWAGKGLREIRAAAENDPETVLDKNFTADIQSGRNLGTIAAPSPEYEDAPVYVIETDGDLAGSVNIANLSYEHFALRHYGIIVGGAIAAPINVRYNMEMADIISASIDAPITIGWSAKGAIVATAENGQIHSVEIGYANEGLTPQDPGYDPIIDVYDDIYPKGFKGIDCSPVDPDFAPPSDVYTHADWTAVDEHCAGPANFDNGSVDSVIRASYIGSIRLAAMTDRWRVDFPGKSNFARVESPEIGSLEIGLLRNGVVWSGNLTMDNGNLVWDPDEA